MTDTAIFKAPKSRKGVKTDPAQNLSPFPKRKRTAEDFYMFCNVILEYENYEAQKQLQDLRQKESGSPVDSGGSGIESFSSGSTSSSSTSSQDDNKNQDIESDEDSYDLVTCFCLKPFAGRPMIECSSCLTWIHLSCAKIRRSNIPEEYICQQCKDSKALSRRSQRAKLSDLDSPPPPTS